jgi:hypothetical protein
VGCTKYASQVPSGVVMVTSDSVVAAAPPAGVPGDAAALPDAAGDVAGSAGAHPRGTRDARPAPIASEPKVRLDRCSWRRRYATMSSKESLSHMRAS